MDFFKGLFKWLFPAVVVLSVGSWGANYLVVKPENLTTEQESSVKNELGTLGTVEEHRPWGGEREYRVTPPEGKTPEELLHEMYLELNQMPNKDFKLKTELPQDFSNPEFTLRTAVVAGGAIDGATKILNDSQ